MQKRVAPPVGAWIETCNAVDKVIPHEVAPPVGAWIETKTPIIFAVNCWGSRPPWARGLKLDWYRAMLAMLKGRAPRGRVD